MFDTVAPPSIAIFLAHQLDGDTAFTVEVELDGGGAIYGMAVTGVQENGSGSMLLIGENLDGRECAVVIDKIAALTINKI